MLLVIAAHYAIPGFSGGFIGVDIFFVISGYLITGLLVREHQTTGRIALWRFYANRLRRLLPALASMLIISAALIWWLLPVSQHPAQSQGAAMAALWVSNLFFAFADVDYFAAETSGNAFLHTWSLGVEEQFYLLWPLLILLIAPWAKGQPQRLAGFWLAVAALSLLACLWLVQNQAVLAFYLMPTRAWQFAAGALAWLLVQHRRPSKAQAHSASWLGWALLGLSLIVITPVTPYPSAWALLPTTASMALLWAGAQAPPRNCRPVLHAHAGHRAPVICLVPLALASLGDRPTTTAHPREPKQHPLGAMRIAAGCHSHPSPG